MRDGEAKTYAWTAAQLQKWQSLAAEWTRQERAEIAAEKEAAFKAFMARVLTPVL